MAFTAFQDLVSAHHLHFFVDFLCLLGHDEHFLSIPEIYFIFLCSFGRISIRVRKLGLNRYECLEVLRNLRMCEYGAVAEYQG